MVLSQEDITQALRDRKHASIISRAVWHQLRIKFHSETHVQADLSVQSRPLKVFLKHVEKLLPKDKFEMFCELLRFPLKTNELTGICFDKLSRIFEGKNPAFNYQFVSSELRDDWEWYRQNRLHEPNVWSSRAWEWFKTDINAVLIVDLPTMEEQDPTDSYPQPYFYFLRVEDVMEYEVNHRTGNMEYIIFRQPGDKIAVFDDASFRIFDKPHDSLEIGALLLEQPHDLGYTPARWFWNESVSLGEPDLKRSPLTKELDTLDTYLFKYISKNHLDLYGAYPIYSGYEQQCDYSERHENETWHCSQGYLKNDLGENVLDKLTGRPLECPKCKGHLITGAGSFVRVPIPHGKPEDVDYQPDLRKPVDITTIDEKSLKWNTDEVERIKREIISSVCGDDSDLLQTKALNEDQVASQFESASSILKRVKKGFEEAQQFVDDTCCRLRYGGENFIQSSISYGTEFYPIDATELSKQYQQRKTNGASQSELGALKKKIIEAEHQNNPLELQRALILNDLEPFNLMTLGEVQNLYMNHLANQEDLVIKANFTDFIGRFERENINIIEFGDAIPYKTKIEKIYESLTSYANEQIGKRDERVLPPDHQGGGE